MLTDAKRDEPLSLDIQDVMKNLISAIRIVKIYPSNNPIYSQSLKKSFETLSHFLQTAPDYHVGVQKTFFTYRQIPFGKDAQMNRSIAQDLFSKGIREIIFSAGTTEEELLQLCQALALSSEELAIRSGISTILWEKGSTNIKVTEAGLDDVIPTKAEGGREGDKAGSGGKSSKPKKEWSFTGRTLVLGDLKSDPEGFAAFMLDYAQRTRSEHESMEDRLFTLYRQAGNKILKDHPRESDIMFDALAKSVLALEFSQRDRFIRGKLYSEVDRATEADQEAGPELQIPTEIQEIRAGRFSNRWTMEQVATLLKKSAAIKTAPSALPPDPASVRAVPVAADLIRIVRSLDDEDPDQIEALKVISNAGMESDIIEAAVHTLVSLISFVKDTRSPASEKQVSFFSGVVQQLEDIHGYLLKKNSYDLATIIIKTLHLPVAPAFQPRMTEALKKTATKTTIKETVAEMRKYPKKSSEYLSAYAYLSSLEQKTVEYLLNMLTEENDREARIFILDLLKDFGKNEFTLLGEHLGDERWYVVRNIVSILAESKAERAIAMLRRAADNKNAKIRQEVIKALISIGGKKAAGVLAKILKDQDIEMQLSTIRAFAEMPGLGAGDATPLIEFLQERPLKKKEQEVTLAAIRALGKIGGSDAAVFLNGFKRIRWWRSHKLQAERRGEALHSIEQITRRQADGRRKQR